MAERWAAKAMNRFLAKLKHPGKYPLIVAHRGDSFFAPENTLEAARRARGAADAWELDVQLSRDGVPIVLHDDSLARTTDIRERFRDDPRGEDQFLVSDFDAGEIGMLDAGSWFVSDTIRARSARAFGTIDRIDAASRSLFESGEVRIPLLVDALRLTAKLDWLVNVAVLNAIAETETADRVLVSSFDHRIVAALVRAKPDPGLAFGLLADSPLWELPRYASELVGASTVHLSAESLGAGSVEHRRRRDQSALASREVESLNAGGVPVLVYTVNEHGPSSLASRLAGIGVAGLFTDDPCGMRRSFEALT